MTQLTGEQSPSPLVPLEVNTLPREMLDVRRLEPGKEIQVDGDAQSLFPEDVLAAALSTHPPFSEVGTSHFEFSAPAALRLSRDGEAPDVVIVRARLNAEVARKGSPFEGNYRMLGDKRVGSDYFMAIDTRHFNSDPPSEVSGIKRIAYMTPTEIGRLSNNTADGHNFPDTVSRRHATLFLAEGNRLSAIDTSMNGMQLITRRAPEISGPRKPGFIHGWMQRLGLARAA